MGVGNGVACMHSEDTPAQSDRGLRCPSEESLGPWLPTERTAKTLEYSLGAHAMLLVLS